MVGLQRGQHSLHALGARPTRVSANSYLCRHWVKANQSLGKQKSYALQHFWTICWSGESVVNQFWREFAINFLSVNAFIHRLNYEFWVVVKACDWYRTPTAWTDISLITRTYEFIWNRLSRAIEPFSGRRPNGSRRLRPLPSARVVRAFRLTSHLNN